MVYRFPSVILGEVSRASQSSRSRSLEEDLPEISKVSEISEVSFGRESEKRRRCVAAAGSVRWSSWKEGRSMEKRGESGRNGHRWCLAWFTTQRRPFHMGMILFNSPWRPGRVSDNLSSLYNTLPSTHRFDFYQQVLLSPIVALAFLSFRACPNIEKSWKKVE